MNLCPPEVFALLVSQSVQSAEFTGWGTLRREDCGGGMTSLLLGVVEEVRHKETVKYIRSSGCQGGHVWQHTEYSLAALSLGLFAKTLLEWTPFSPPFREVVGLISVDLFSFSRGSCRELRLLESRCCAGQLLPGDRNDPPRCS